MDNILKLCVFDESWVESKHKGDYKSVLKMNEVITQGGIYTVN